jgi:hypothetical protein
MSSLEKRWSGHPHPKQVKADTGLNLDENFRPIIVERCYIPADKI